MDLQHTKCSPLYNNNTWSSLWTNKVENNLLGTYLKLPTVMACNFSQLGSVWPWAGNAFFSSVVSPQGTFGNVWYIFDCHTGAALSSGWRPGTLHSILYYSVHPSPTPSLEELSSPRCQPCWRLNCSLNSEWGLTSNVRLFRFLWWDILILVP